ncbi:MAG: hypothetical protein Ct9H90mP23_2100 [Methanobacteriota archaeon]|nr:MAG: hypothetical protein Ct9H90mP23_2100 [Euryarchaeota archaeon]
MKTEWALLTQAFLKPVEIGWADGSVWTESQIKISWNMGTGGIWMKLGRLWWWNNPLDLG